MKRKRRGKKQEIITTLDIGDIIRKTHMVPTPNYEGNKLQQLIRKIKSKKTIKF